MDQTADIIEIMGLKARYCRYVDQKKWEQWSELFTPDLHVDVTGSLPPPYETFNDASSFCAFISTRLNPAITVHHVHNPEIEIVGPDSARGWWALFDHIEYPDRETDRGLVGYGHYEETYRKVERRWLISSLILTRVFRRPLPTLP